MEYRNFSTSYTIVTYSIKNGHKFNFQSVEYSIINFTQLHNYFYVSEMSAVVCLKTKASEAL